MEIKKKCSIPYWLSPITLIDVVDEVIEKDDYPTQSLGVVFLPGIARWYSVRPLCTKASLKRDEEHVAHTRHTMIINNHFSYETDFVRVVVDLILTHDDSILRFIELRDR
jgi:hypothetical protein